MKRVLRRPFFILAVLLAVFSVIVIMVAANGVKNNSHENDNYYLLFKGNVYTKYYNESVLIHSSWIIEGGFDEGTETAYYIRSVDEKDKIVDKDLKVKVNTYRNDLNNIFINVDGGILFDPVTYAKTDVQLPNCFDEIQKIQKIVIENSDIGLNVELTDVIEIQNVMRCARTSAFATDTSCFLNVDNSSIVLYVKVYFFEFPAYYNLGIISKSVDGEIGIECNDRDYSISPRALVELPSSIGSMLVF